LSITDANKLKVKDVEIHYIDEGQGDPLVFLHGVPTSGRVWSQVLPYFTDHARCIVPDLPGFGESSKPDIEYKITDHIEYLSAFLDALDLKNVTFVSQAWGSIIAFDYARRHEDRVSGLAFFESYLRPITDWTMMSLPMQELAAIVNQEDNAAVLESTDYFIEKLLPRAMLKEMSDEDTIVYRDAINQTAHHQPLLQYLREVPTGAEPAYMTEIISDYSKWLQKTDIPKLLIYGVPGYNATMSTIAWAKSNLPALTMADIGPMLHFPQVSCPQEFSEALLRWYQSR
jgi:haloalkane dehalogenase